MRVAGGPAFSVASCASRCGLRGLMIVDTSRDIVLKKQVPLFDVSPYYFGGVGRNYDVTADGQRFVMVANPINSETRTIPIAVVLNWIEELRSRTK